MQQISTESIEEEIWKDIIGYEGHYQISNKGRIYSLKSKKYRKPNLNRDGYFYISLCLRGFQRTYKIHRLVCSAFIGFEKDKNHVDHIDGNKKNNFSNNLRWCTHFENIKFAHELGIYKQKGAEHPLSILKDEDVIAIKKRLNSGEKAASIHNDYGVKINAVYDIKQGRTWTHIK